VDYKVTRLHLIACLIHTHKKTIATQTHFPHRLIFLMWPSQCKWFIRT